MKFSIERSTLDNILIIHWYWKVFVMHLFFNFWNVFIYDGVHDGGQFKCFIFKNIYKPMKL
jgi:hypothetical protein